MQRRRQFAIPSATPAHMRRLSDQPDIVSLSISGDEYGREPGTARAATRKVQMGPLS